MPISNLNNTHLSTAQVQVVNDALTQLETALQSININLTADDRKRYGSINEQNKLFVNKVHDSPAELRSPEVDWEEFENDYQSRRHIERILARMEALTTRLQNAKTLHDYDNYQSALTDYGYTSYKAGTTAAGYEDKRNELKQFFKKSSSADAPPAQ